jgi:hypothetical protein
LPTCQQVTTADDCGPATLQRQSHYCRQCQQFTSDK